MNKIVTVPDPRLRQKSTPVTSLDKKTIKVISDLVKTLTKQKDPEGVGISAPQIGVNKRVFVIRQTVDGKQLAAMTKNNQLPTTNDKYRIIINPEILEYSKDTNWDHLPPEDHYYEGCLSIPGVYGEVTRPWSIKVKYQTLVNEKLQMTNVKLTGLPAIYFQHEFDHLEGILFTDLVLKQGGKLYEQVKEGEFAEVK